MRRVNSLSHVVVGHSKYMDVWFLVQPRRCQSFGNSEQRRARGTESRTRDNLLDTPASGVSISRAGWVGYLRPVWRGTAARHRVALLFVPVHASAVAAGQAARGRQGGAPIEAAHAGRPGVVHVDQARLTGHARTLPWTDPPLASLARLPAFRCTLDVLGRVPVPHCPFNPVALPGAGPPVLPSPPPGHGPSPVPEPRRGRGRRVRRPPPPPARPP